MCRLLGWAAASPRSAADLLGDHLDGFTELSERHADGWGAAFADNGAGTRVVKEPVPARTSAGFASAMRVPTPAAAVHLRWATGGLTVQDVNTHPFLRDGIAFAHNGHVQDTDRAESLIDTDLVGPPAGTTDSERYFLAVLTQLRRGASPAEALAAVAAGLAGTPSTSMNCLLLTPEQLVAACLHDPSLLPPDEVPDYFHLGADRLIGPDDNTVAVVVGSSGVLPEAGEPVPALSPGTSADGWFAGRREVPNGSALVIDRASLRTELVALQ
jgi:predicted glutamine amidotransferase